MLRAVLLVVVLASCLSFPALGAKKTPTKEPLPDNPEVSDDEAAAPQPESTANPDSRSSSKVTGTFSTLQSFGEGGDLIGVEVMIVGTRDGLQAVVQTADGLPGSPVVVPVEVDGMRVSFPIPSASGDLMQFKGKVTPQSLTGTLDGRPLTLPRRRSYWR
ncbi:MAG: hypothetical protein ABW205_00100 [Burkholderiales bacterium]